MILFPPVYPRSRGEHVSGVYFFEYVVGLSPLSRGTLLTDMRGHLYWRFIPALAGNTRWPLIICQKYPGLSPLSRGTHPVTDEGSPYSRFIPALAGNTAPFASEPVSAAVYPRSRGEHRWFCGERGECDGLSPLSRGTRAIRKVSALTPRFIPALAGNTSGSASKTGPMPVYPRSRGEHASSAAVSNSFFGLSPLSRGTLCARGRAYAGQRFIPALAGNTCCCRIHNLPITVYPRSRGEHNENDLY